MHTPSRRAVRLIVIVALATACLALAAPRLLRMIERWLPERPDHPAAHVDVDASKIHYRVSTGHPRILLNDAATLSRLQQRLRDKVPAATRFEQLVDAQMSGADEYGFQPWFAALLYRVTDQPRYARFAISLTDAAVNAEELLINQDRPAKVADDSYLDVGWTIGNVALVYDWCHELLTPSQRSRWLTYANQSVWNVWNPRQAQWGNKRYPWTGWSVDNPSNNYHYSFLRATMLLGLASQGESERAQGWLDTFRVDKLEAQLFPTFDRDLEGGGSREGTGYGAAMRNLFLLYDWWERSTGERLADRTPHTLASIAHLMHSTVPTLDRLAPTGDHARESSAALYDYHRSYLQELITLFPNEPLSGVARTYLKASSVPSMRDSFNAYSDYLYGDSDLPGEPLDRLATTYLGRGTGQLMMRSDWSKDAAFANVICGPYTESHAHRDQGSFVLYKQGWLATDANTKSRSGLEQGEEFHNLVRLQTLGTPLKQRGGPGCKLKALTDNALFTYADADVLPAYAGNRALQENRREILFIKPVTFVVLDRVMTQPGTQRIWTLNVPSRPEVSSNHLRIGTDASGMDVEMLRPANRSTTVVRWTEASRDISDGYRIDVADREGLNEPFLNILTLGGPPFNAASQVSADGLGVSTPLPDGRRAVMRFSTNGGVGTLTLSARDGTRLYEGPLGGAVMTLPLFAH